MFSENGIIKQAQDAKEETRGATVEEERSLWQIGKTTSKYTSGSSTETLEELLQRLVSNGQLTEEEKAEVEETGQVTIGNRTIVFGKAEKTLVDMFKKAQEDNCDNNDGSCSNAEHLHVGDYLNYTPISGKTISLTVDKTGASSSIGTQTYTVDMSTTWRVLGLNESETQILITSGSPIKRNGEDPYFHLASGEGVTYAEQDLNNICNIYYNNKFATEARSMKMEDILLALGITVDKENNKAYKTADENKADLPYMGFFGQSYTYKAGDYAVENYMETGSVKVGDKVDGSAYALMITESAVVDQNSKIYDVLFKGTTNEENRAKAYWLASSGVSIGSDDAYFGPGIVGYGMAAAGGNDLFGSNGLCIEFWMAVRPVVSLKSNISASDLQIVAGEESDWTTSIPDSYSGQSLTKGQVLSD